MYEKIVCEGPLYDTVDCHSRLLDVEVFTDHEIEADIDFCCIYFLFDKARFIQRAPLLDD